MSSDKRMMFLPFMLLGGDTDYWPADIPPKVQLRPKREYPTTTVRNRKTGKERLIPQHMVETFLSRRINWEAVNKPEAPDETK